MLEHDRFHDELLSVEEANSGLIEELRAIYQLTPEEQRVLSRVHERLQLYAQPLPARDPVEVGQFAAHRDAPYAAAAFTRRSFLTQINSVAALLFVALLVGALAFTFATVKHPTPAAVNVNNGIRVMLVPAQTSTPSKEALTQTAAILSQRLSSFGLQGYSIQVQNTGKQTGIQLHLPHFGDNEQQTLNILLGTGVLAFWDTGSLALPLGTLFDPNQFSNLNPDDHPLFTGQDLDPNSLQVGNDQNTGLPVIACSMQGEAVQSFQQFTSSHIGDSMTITLDNKVLSSPVIQSAIGGPFIIAGNFSQDQARAIVAVLKSGPLPVAMKRLS